MNKEILPIGTLINIQGKFAIIAGYLFRNISGKVKLQYTVIPYPQGYTTPENIKVFTQEDFAIVSMGYEGDEYKYLKNYYTEIVRVADTVSGEELKQYMDSAVQIIKERQSNG